MSHDNLERGDYADPITRPKRNWYSTAPGGQVNPLTGETHDYCEFCWYNYKVWNEVINNICQSCGRAADYITKDKQDLIKVNALNDIVDEEQSFRPIMMEIEYPFLKGDETIDSRTRSDRRMTTDLGAGHAMKMIRESETTFDKNNIPFRVKVTPKDKTVLFDEKKD